MSVVSFQTLEAVRLRVEQFSGYGHDELRYDIIERQCDVANEIDFSSKVRQVVVKLALCKKHQFCIILHQSQSYFFPSRRTKIASRIKRFKDKCSVDVARRFRHLTPSIAYCSWEGCRLLHKTTGH